MVRATIANLDTQRGNLGQLLALRSLWYVNSWCPWLATSAFDTKMRQTGNDRLFQQAYVFFDV